MMDSIDSSFGSLQEVRARRRENIPLGRYGTPAEVAALAAFLCSDDAGFCTGASYLADGGLMAGR